MTAYRMVREANGAGRFDAVLFTRSSTVRALVCTAGTPDATTAVACAGPQTARDGSGPPALSAIICTGESS